MKRAILIPAFDEARRLGDVLRVGERCVTMAQSVRVSSLHSGWAPIYYVYKMMLSVWAASAGWARPPR